MKLRLGGLAECGMVPDKENKVMSQLDKNFGSYSYYLLTEYAFRTVIY